MFDTNGFNFELINKDNTTRHISDKEKYKFSEELSLIDLISLIYL